jgi:single-strand DNA-binding protein
MRDMNRVTLLGRLGADPVLRVTQTGKHVAQLRLATTEYFRPAGADQDSQPQEKTTWHKVVVWGKQAKTCAQYLKKGRPVFVDGSIRAHTYTDSSNVSRLSVEVHADTVSFLGSSGKATSEVPSTLTMESDVPIDLSSMPTEALAGEPVEADATAEAQAS